MGFRHIDDIILEERIQQQALKKALDEARLNNEIISAISKIYFAIYRIDLKKDFYEKCPVTVKCIHCPEHVEKRLTA